MKMAAKAKSVSKPDEKNHSQKNNLSHLAKAIIANAGVGIYIVQHGKFVYVSQLYQKLTGYSEAELIDTYSLGSIYPDDGEDIDSLLRNSDMAMYFVKTHWRNNYEFFAHVNQS